MRKLEQEEINYFKKMVKDIDKKMAALIKCKEELQKFIDTKVAYDSDDIKKG